MLDGLQLDPGLAGRLSVRPRLPDQEPLPPGRHDLGLFDQRDAVLVVPDGVDPRAGHIPGSVSVPSREHAGPDGRIAGAQQLRARFAAAGVTDGSDVIASCGSGVTACLNLLAIEHAGIATRSARLFPGSWSQWSRDTGRPVQT